jgi:DNA-binding MarR family transcriptional regulator
MPSDPSDLRTHLGFWLRTVSNAVSQRFARRVEAEGVTVAEWVVMRVLYDSDSISPSHLAGQMGMTKGAISKLVDRLATKGLVARTPSPSDRRAHMVALTPAGRGKVPVLAALADANDAEFFGALSPAERASLDRLLKAIVERQGLTRPPTD